MSHFVLNTQTNPTPPFSDEEIEEHMQMAARMLFDILRDYLARHGTPADAASETESAVETQRGDAYHSKRKT